MFKKIISKIYPVFIPCEENDYRPRFLQSNFLPYFLIVLFLLKIIIIPFLIYFPEANLFADISKAVLIELTNKERQKLGLNPLKENSQLNQAALLKAQDILSLDYFAHWNPQGKSPWYWIKKANYNYQAAGENLGIGFLDSTEVYQAWTDSPSHKANLVSPEYQETGIAVLKGDFKGNEAVIVVQLFGTLKKESKVKNQEIKKQEIKDKEEKIVEPISKKKEQEKQPAETTTPAMTTAKEEVKNEPEEKEIIKEKPKQKIAGIEAKKEEKKEKTSFLFSLLKFMSLDYSNLTQEIIFCSLILIIFALLINVLVHIRIQQRDLIYKTIFCILLLILFVFIDKDLIIQIIPHNLEIN